MNNISLVKANKNDYLTVQNLGIYYIYEMSKYCGINEPSWAIPANGLYECNNFQNYFESPDRYPFLIKFNNEIAGFALINKVGSTNLIDWNMGEFFILARYHNKGIGSKIACEIFDTFKGNWEVAVIPDNQPALKFWRKVIKIFSNDNFHCEQKIVSYPKTHLMMIFSFKSN